MMRVLALATLILLGSATTANADSRADEAAAGGSERALLESVAATGKAALPLSVHNDALRLQIGAMAHAKPTLRAVAPRTEARRLNGATLVAVGGEQLATAPASHRRVGMATVDSRAHRPTLAYPVSASFSLALGYRYLQGEDLVFKAADPGALNPSYDSHNVSLRAHWRF